jgi:hypothetical protein
MRHLTQFDFPSKHNLSATVDPTSFNDSSEGYEHGSIWINTITDTAYICVDNSVGAAIWSNISDSVSLGSFGGSAFTTSLGLVGYITIPYSGTITGWQVIGDISGDCVFDVWKSSAGTIPTVLDTITGTEKPTLSSQQINSNLSLTSWTTNVVSGDVVAINLDSASTLNQMWLTVFITKTS